MKQRYHRLFIQHTFVGIAGGLITLLCLSACIVRALADHPGQAFSLAAGALLFLLIFIAEFREAIQCLRISRRWDGYDRRDLPPHHLHRP